MRIKEYVPGSGQSQKSGGKYIGILPVRLGALGGDKNASKMLGFLGQEAFDSEIDDDDKLIKFLAENYIPDHPLRPTFREDVPSDPRKFLDDKDTLLGECEKVCAKVGSSETHNSSTRSLKLIVTVQKMDAESKIRHLQTD